MAQFLDYTGLGHFKDKNDALYAKQDGSYTDLTAGLAEQLQSSVGIEDQTPYNFRTSGGSTEIGDREELNAVVGVSVPWNQNLKEVNSTNWAATAASTSVSISDGVATVTAGSQYAGLISTAVNRPTFPNGRKMFYSVSVKLTTAVANAIKVKINNQDQKFAASSTAWQIISGFFTWDSTKAATFQILDFRASDRDAYQVKEPMLIDLTQMFGSTIADYIYSLEQSNAGAGVAYFRKYFPKLFYGYSAPTMQSVKTSAHKMVGFNQFDEVCESGYINTSTGENDDSVPDTRYRSKNYIRVVPNTTYYYKASVSQTNNSVKARIYFYDASKSFISSALTSAISDTFTTPSNCGFIRFFVNQALSTYNHDICINISWDGERDGEYEPYVAHEYALDDITLRGILKLDASNNLYADGDRYLPDGTVIRKRRQMVANGDTVKATSVNQSSGTYYCVLTTLSSANKAVNSTTTETRIITDKGYRDYSGVGVGHIYITGGGLTPVICLFDQTLTTVDAVNTYLASNPITIEYELATPTTESADPYQKTQIVDDFGTEEFVDAAVEANERDVAIFVGNETVYKPNLRAKLEMMPDSPDGAGDYIMRSDGSEQTWVPLTEVKELPDVPTTDGTYVLKCTVSDGTATLTWVSE